MSTPPPPAFFTCMATHVPEIPCESCGYDDRRRTNPVRFPLTPGDILTIYWSGEPRTVVVDSGDGGLILRDQTAAEVREMTDEMADAARDLGWQA